MEPNYPFDPYDWTTIQPLFRQLIDVPIVPITAAGFMEWFDQWNALDIAVNDAWTTLKRRSYTDTANVEAEDAYRIFTREMFSTYIELTNTLAARALTLQPEPPTSAHRQLWRRWQNQTTLFHPDSVGLQAEISELESSYRELTRQIEQLPGDAIAHWLARRTELNELMLRLLRLRRDLAHTCGLPTFLAFRWRELNRLDATIKEYQGFHQAVEEIVIPTLVQLRASHPADSVYPEITDPDKLAAAVEAMLDKLDPTFGAVMRTMRAGGYLDLGARPAKAVTSEQWFFPRTGMPHLHSDSTNLGTVLHEMGHALHAYLSFQVHPSMWNHAGPDEFQEFAATALYELCLPYYEQAHGGVFTAAEYGAIRRHDILRGYLGITAWGVMEDAFEHWIYGEAPEDVTTAQIDTKWLEMKQRYMPWEASSGNELEVMTGWQRWNWSLFRMPLYAIAYPIDTIATFLFGQQAQTDRAGCIEAYKAALLLGNTKSLLELFGAVGITFPFSQQAVGEAVQYALDEYAKAAKM